MNILNRIDRGIMRVEEIFSAILLSGIIVLVFIAAFMRQIRMPIVWSVDMATLLFVWVCFIGADIAMERNKHIGVDLLTNALPQGIQKGIRLVMNCLIITFLGIISWYGAYLAIINTADQFAGMEISHSWATWSAPVGCVLMIRTMIKKTVGLFPKANGVKVAS